MVKQQKSKYKEEEDGEDGEDKEDEEEEEKEEDEEINTYGQPAFSDNNTLVHAGLGTLNMCSMGTQ